MSNFEAYESKYKNGYGVMYPEGHIIRFYEHFLKYELNIDGSKSEKILDFGCGNATHSLYFKSKGFDVYGVDISSIAIEIAKNRLKQCEDNFKCIKENERFDDVFNVKFDIIIANQSLYYLDNENLKQLLASFDRLLNNNGLVFFTMMGTKNIYYKYSTPTQDFVDSGLYKVKLNGRLKETTYINFIDNEDELKSKFNIFEPYFIGSYDDIGREGSGFHYKFIGKKR